MPEMFVAIPTILLALLYIIFSVHASLTLDDP
jgi:hypothetical protein